MICPSCNQETEEGKFCTKCGQPLSQQETTPSEPAEPVEAVKPANEPVQAQQTYEAANAQPSQEQAAPTAETAGQTAQQQQPETTPYTMNDLGEAVKKASGGFGRFALNQLKSPGQARSLTEQSWISGAITIVLTALLYTIILYITLNEISSSSPPFVESFLVPFLKFLLFFIISVAVIYGTGKLMGSQDNFFSTTAKTGGYLFPYSVLFLAGYLFAVIGLDFMVYVMLLAMLAPILIIPAYVLMESLPREIDKIYALMVVYLIQLISGYYLLLQTLFFAIFDGVMSSFPFF